MAERPTFRDLSAVLRPNLPGRAYGTVIADFVGDGRAQIAVVCPDGPNRLFRFDGVRFADIADRFFADADRAGIGCAAADVNRSGRLALYVLNTDRFLGPTPQADALLVTLTPGAHATWRDIAETVGPAGRGLIEPINRGSGRSVCFADLTGNGWPDLAIANYAVPSMLYINRGNDPETGQWLGYANVAPPGRGVGAVTGGRALVAADFFDSGRLDLFAINENDANRFFRNDGVTDDGTLRLTECASRIGLDDPQHHGRGVAVGDFNRDGRLDVVFGNWEGPHRLMFQRDDRTFEDRTPPEMREPSRVRTVIAADFNNDGHLDIFFNNLGQPNRLFINDGEGNFRLATPDELLLPDDEGTGASVGDLTGDGRLDLFISCGESRPQPCRLLLNDDESPRHWLRVHAQTPEGAPAIGARVRLVASGASDSRPQTRFIDGGSGYLCQMEPVAHFGLGAAARVDALTVRWTTGEERTLTNVPADQNLVIRPG